MSNSRIKNVIRNSSFGIISQTLAIVLNFTTRTFFITYLGKIYLGLNGLFTNILTLFSLVELGLGTAIIYSLYKPIAEKNHSKLISYINYYKKIYLMIAIAIFSIGFIFSFFLDFIVKEKNIDNMRFIFFLFLINTVLSYSYAHYRSLIIANQKDFLISKIRIYLNFLKAILQIGSLYFFQSFILFLIVQIVITLMENYIVFIKGKNLIDKKLPVENLSLNEKKAIWTNVKSLMIYKIGGTLLDTTDQVVISILLGVLVLGELSNYLLIISAVSIVLFQVFNSITSSVGNFIVLEKKEGQKNLLYALTLFSHVIYGMTFIFLYYLMNPMIKVWIGPEYLLDKKVVIVLLINWYISGMLNSIWIFRTNLGLFKYGQYRPIVSAVINIILSVIGGIYIGLLGVFLATTITRFLTNIWFDPLIVFKYGFSEKPYNFYVNWILYAFITAVSIISSDFIIKFALDTPTDIKLIFGECIISFLIFLLLTLILKSNSNEIKFFSEKVKFLLKK